MIDLQILIIIYVVTFLICVYLMRIRIINFVRNNTIVELIFLDDNYNFISKWIKNPGSVELIEYESALYAPESAYYADNTKHFIFYKKKIKSLDLTEADKIKNASVSIDVKKIQYIDLTPAQAHRKLKLKLADMFEDSFQEQMKFYIMIAILIIGAIGLIIAIQNQKDIKSIPPLIDTLKNISISIPKPNVAVI